MRSKASQSPHSPDSIQREATIWVAVMNTPLATVATTSQPLCRKKVRRDSMSGLPDAAPEQNREADSRVQSFRFSPVSGARLPARLAVWMRSSSTWTEARPGPRRREVNKPRQKPSP